MSVAVAALALGVALGWLLWGRALAQQQSREDDYKNAIRDLAAAQKEIEQIAPLRDEVASLRADREALAALRAQQEERDRQHAEREADLNKRFDEMANAALSKTYQSFVERAEETLKLHRETATQDLSKNRTELDKLIGPMRETLEKYEKKLGEIETARATAYGAITNAIADVKAGQERVSGEAARLVNALRNAPKARGRWGEHQLRRVLEMAGLSPHCDFSEEVSRDTEDGRLRPDVVVQLPNRRVLVIDAKCSLNAYQDAVAADDDDERRAHMLAHAKALRGHVDALGRKSYAEQFGDALDFVIMFVPGENFLAAALEVDQELFEAAFQKRVLLASPTNLIAIARTVAMVWQQERAADDARKIARLGKELHDRIATMGEHVGKLGKNLGTAMNAYNAFVGSLESQVMPAAQRLSDHAIEPPNKTIEELPRLASDPRPLTKLSAPEAEAAE
jgi:DNA recombination protein RmuC